MADTKVYVFYLSMMAFLWGSMGAVYQAGDSAGWSNTKPNYKSWASQYKFEVGDTIAFNYDPQYHNVVEVSKKEFEECSFGAPLATYGSGNDSIKLITPGDHYFICSFPGHCKDGQKVQIVVKKGKRDEHRSPTLNDDDVPDDPPSYKDYPQLTPISPPPPTTPTTERSASSALSFHNVLGLVALASCVFRFYLH